jgi:O-acetyl-ADP-ribose deacetylase (regulator of RNase III)
MIVVNGITQDMYGRNGKQYVDYDAVREVFNSTVDMCWQLYQDYENGETMDIAIPKIGAGLGGGDWKVIEEIIDEETGADLDVVVYVLNESEIPPNRVRV